MKPSIENVDCDVCSWPLYALETKSNGARTLSCLGMAMRANGNPGPTQTFTAICTRCGAEHLMERRIVKGLFAK